MRRSVMEFLRIWYADSYPLIASTCRRGDNADVAVDWSTGWSFESLPIRGFPLANVKPLSLSPPFPFTNLSSLSQMLLLPSNRAYT